MNVVEAWRSRHFALRREVLLCPECGHCSRVRRRRCPSCKSRRAAETRSLRVDGQVLACTDSGMLVERLDQLSDRQIAVLLEVEGMRLACLVADSDCSRFADLHEVPMRLVLRRNRSSPAGSADAIEYGVKARVSSTGAPQEARVKRDSLR
jgi:uncharacterized OB-fold protein